MSEVVELYEGSFCHHCDTSFKNGERVYTGMDGNVYCSWYCLQNHTTPNIKQLTDGIVKLVPFVLER